MSPAPQRTPKADPYRSFPHSWGYGLGVLLMLLGIGVAVFLVFNGIRGFTQDVRDFRRVVDTENLEINLEEGEYFVFDEDGLDLGPFNAKVTRISDGREIPTNPVDGGTSYDVDGRKGQAKLSFDVPTSDIYRVELDSSLGDVAAFAVGADAGNGRTTAITRGLLLGTVFFILGLVAILVTLIQHARWRVREEVTRRAGKAREIVAEVVGQSEDSTPAQPEPPPSLEKAASWGRDRLDQVRETAPAPADLAERIDQAMGRVQERVASGDSLREIASDERVMAEEAAQELAGQARDAAQVARAEVASLVEADPPVPTTVEPQQPQPQTTTTDVADALESVDEGDVPAAPQEAAPAPMPAPVPTAGAEPLGAYKPAAGGFSVAPPPASQAVRPVATEAPEGNDTDQAESAGAEPAEERPEPDRHGFSLAPPPDYASPTNG